MQTISIFYLPRILYLQRMHNVTFQYVILNCIIDVIKKQSEKDGGRQKHLGRLSTKHINRRQKHKAKLNNHVQNA